MNNVWFTLKTVTGVNRFQLSSIAVMEDWGHVIRLNGGVTIRGDKELYQQVLDQIAEQSGEVADGQLFRHWIQAASETPSKVATALTECTTADEYRAAITTLMEGSDATS